MREERERARWRGGGDEEREFEEMQGNCLRDLKALPDHK